MKVLKYQVNEIIVFPKDGAPAKGTIVKLYSNNSAKIKPIDGSKNVTRRLQFCSKVQNDN